LAGQWARSQGADEALIMNPDATVSETNTAGLIVIQNNKLIRPRSLHVLPSVMQHKAVELLTGRGYVADNQRLTLSDLYASDGVLALNALMGAVPVFSIDQHPIRHTSDLCQMINQEML